MSITRPNVLIPYFTAFLIALHIFISQKLGATAKNRLYILNQFEKIELFI